MVQWIRLDASKAGVGSILIWRTKVPHTTTKPAHHNEDPKQPKKKKVLIKTTSLLNMHQNDKEWGLSYIEDQLVS